MPLTTGTHTDGDDDFVNIWTGASKTSGNTNENFYDQWVDLSSGKLAIPAITGATLLRKLYPKHSLVLTHGYGMNLLGFPAAVVTPLEPNELITNLNFIPLPRYAGVPGILQDQVEHGAFNVSWNGYDFIVYTVEYPSGFSSVTQFFLLHEGPEEVLRLFLLSAGAWVDSLHEEIWVFNQGFWSKSHSLWREVQKADWEDVILNDEFKKALQKDIYGFFTSETIYKELAIPWKRGLIMYGPPGNGKTITLKTVMKTCGEKGFAPLYVKSFKSYKGEEGAMADVFDKARQLSPCVIILEDLDSLINDSNRSFFLNQMDGLESNDGILIIGTTNHFERLDPALSSRPSRFDRKYDFKDPDENERRLYIQYWQKKLENNKEIQFPDSLVIKVARLTDKFSFAYLKEAFVSSLVLLLGKEGDKPSFELILIEQIEVLRKQLDDQLRTSNEQLTASLGQDMRFLQVHPDSRGNNDVHALLDTLSEVAPRVDKLYRTSSDSRSSSFGNRTGHGYRNLGNLPDFVSHSPNQYGSPQGSNSLNVQGGLYAALWPN